MDFSFSFLATECILLVKKHFMCLMYLTPFPCNNRSGHRILAWLMRVLYQPGHNDWFKNEHKSS